MMIKLLKNTIAKIMKSNITPTRKKRKTTGQGLVEFALALPILLTVIYGMIETGRLLFIYGSTVTAARQAARYGSATGNSDNNIPYYRDCAGIDSAAMNTAFIHTYNDINVTYDRGLDSSGNAVAITGIDPAPTADTCPSMDDNTLRNGDRIKVQVTTQWTPIIAIVPSWQGFTITSEAERTILKTIPIGVDPESEIWVPGGALQITVYSATTSFNAAGQVIYYTYTLFNNANFDLNAPFVVSDNIVTNENCTGSPATLAPDETYVCSGSYVVTQADIDAGYITNVATASSVETTTNADDFTIPAIQNKSLTLTKTASPTIATNVGDVVTYTYTLLNSGNVTLSAPYTITDNKISSTDIDCSAIPATLLPNASANCIATYSITSTDVNNASVTNTATAKAFFGAFEVTSNTVTATVNTSPLDLKVVASVSSVSSLNQQIDYVYTIKNVASTAVNGPFAITDDLATNLSCPATGSLAPGNSINCSGQHFVTQAQLDAGTNIVNHAIASAGSINSNMATASVEVSAIKTISLTINAPTPSSVSVGTVLNYTYVITNTGNATLTAPYTINELNIPSTVTCPSSGSLVPGGTITCTMSYTVKTSDLDKGSIVNLAIAKATFGTEEITSAQATAYVITFNGARLSLSISSSPTSFQNRTNSLGITFTLTNTGSVSLTSPFTVTTNSFLGAVNCSGATSPLAFGQSTTCSIVYYTPTSANLAAGSIAITGTATGKYGSTTVTSASASLTIPSSFVCSTSHTAADITFPRVNQMQVDITNDITSSDTVTISSITLANWNFSSHAQQYLSSILLGGVQIYTGSLANRVSPLTISSFSGTVTLAPGQTKTLLFSFNKNYSETNNELITINFAEYGCTPLIAGD